MIPLAIDLNKLAEKITRKEGKQNSLNIGDVKEVMRLTFKELSEMSLIEATGIIKKYAKK